MNAKKIMLTVLIVLSMLFVLPAEDVTSESYSIKIESVESTGTVDEEAPATFSLTTSYVNSQATDVKLVLIPEGEDSEPYVVEMTQEDDEWTSSLELPLPAAGSYYFEVSTDGGETWTETQERTIGGRIEINPAPFVDMWRFMDELRPRPVRPMCRMPRPRRPVLVWL